MELHDDHDRQEARMKLELTKEEAAALMAARYAIDGAKVKGDRIIEQTNAFIHQHEARAEEVAKRIRKRVKGCPDTPVRGWDFSGIDPVTFDGTVNVEDEAKE